jgi:hypothetical protein
MTNGLAKMPTLVLKLEKVKSHLLSLNDDLMSSRERWPKEKDR